MITLPLTTSKFTTTLKPILAAMATAGLVLAAAPDTRALTLTPEEEWMFGSEQTVLLATGRLRSARIAPAVATVITAQDIRDHGFRDVTEALDWSPDFTSAWEQSSCHWWACGDSQDSDRAISCSCWMALPPPSSGWAIS